MTHSDSGRAALAHAKRGHPRSGTYPHGSLFPRLLLFFLFLLFCFSPSSGSLGWSFYHAGPPIRGAFRPVLSGAATASLLRSVKRFLPDPDSEGRTFISPGRVARGEPRGSLGSQVELFVGATWNPNSVVFSGISRRLEPWAATL